MSVADLSAWEGILSSLSKRVDVQSKLVLLSLCCIVRALSSLSFLMYGLQSAFPFLVPFDLFPI